MLAESFFVADFIYLFIGGGAWGRVFFWDVCLQGFIRGRASETQLGKHPRSADCAGRPPNVLSRWQLLVCGARFC